MSRELEHLRGRLDQIERSARALYNHIADLHAQAWERAGHGLEPTGRSTTSGVDVVGDPRAQALWRSLAEEVEEAGKRLAALRAAVHHYLSAGPSPEATRGSMISKGDFRAQLRRQRQRQDAGQYTPHRIESQPNYPGSAA